MKRDLVLPLLAVMLLSPVLSTGCSSKDSISITEMEVCRTLGDYLLDKALQWKLEGYDSQMESRLREEVYNVWNESLDLAIGQHPTGDADYIGDG